MTVLGEQLINSVRAHAAEKPDFIYKSPFGDGSSCVYVFEGCASCLIGQALFDAGLIDALFEDNDGNHEPFGSLTDRLDLALDPHERKWLREVQYWQDGRHPWGEAVMRADECLLSQRPGWHVA